MKAMNKISLYLFATLLSAVIISGCKRDEYDNKSPFDNVIYLNVAQNSETQVTTFKKTLPELKRDISVLLSYPAGEDIAASVKADASLVAGYNARNNTTLEMLDSKYFELSADEVSIPAGRTVSDIVTVTLKNLDGSGDAPELPIDETYLLPVTISGVEGGVSLLESSSTAYYVVRRSSAITSAASLRANWINFPTLDTAGPHSDPFNGLTAVTYEAIIRIEAFSGENVNAEISSIMGIENYLLLRIGDAGFPRQQIQFDGSGDEDKTPGFGKFPEKDDSKILNANEWYHVAATYDYATRKVCIYVNGKLQSEGSDLGDPASKPFNLAMRALYDKSVQEPGVYPDYEKYSGARQFFLGKSYDDSRYLNGDITEVRVWSVARAEQDIWENMYDVDPQTPGLIGYWKFDEGEGNVIRDWTGNGNDAVAEKDLVWPAGIEVPKLNEE